MNLQLSLTKHWFGMTKTRIKPEDYRELTDYWYSRLCLFDGEKKSEKWWCEYFNNHFSLDQYHRQSFVSFEYNIMTLGYPKSTNTDRIIKLEHKGIEVREGNPEWGAKPGKIYFVIKHGALIHHNY